MLRSERSPNAPLPPELAHYVGEPRITLGGCRNLVPYHGSRPYPDGPFHADPLGPADVGDHPWPVESCPACKGLIGRRDAGPVNAALDETTGCLWDHAMSPRNEARLGRQRALTDARKLQDMTNIAAANSGAHAARTAAVTLTEAERRAIWNGRRGGIRCPLDLDDLERSLRAMHRDAPKFLDRVRVGRAFLEQIDQLPNWSLVRFRGRWVERSSLSADDLAEIRAADGKPTLRAEAA